MKNYQKGFIVPLLIIIVFILAIGGGIYIYTKNKQPSQNLINSTSHVTESPKISVAGMSQYTDEKFGFSFWYPNDWQIAADTVKNPTKYPGGIIVKQLNITEKSTNINLEPQHITIEEFSSPNFSITDSTGVGACPVCVPTHYYYNLSQHTWMVEYPKGTPTGASGSPEPANVSNNTMGSLHMFAGSQRFGANTIIPLSARDFVIVTVDGGLATGSGDPLALAKTIVATDPSVGTPVSISQQQVIIKAEQTVYTNY